MALKTVNKDELRNRVTGRLSSRAPDFVSEVCIDEYPNEYFVKIITKEGADLEAFDRVAQELYEEFLGEGTIVIFRVGTKESIESPPRVKESKSSGGNA